MKATDYTMKDALGRRLVRYAYRCSDGTITTTAADWLEGLRRAGTPKDKLDVEDAREAELRRKKARGE